MVNTVVFDIGNVLVDFCWQELFLELGFTGEKFDIISRATIKHPMWNELDKGELSVKEIIEAFVENAPEYESDIRSIFEHAGKLVKGRDYAKGWIRQLQERGCKVYILSNMNQPVYDANRDGCMSFIDEADGAIMSYQEKMIKPDRCIYELLCERFQIVPETAVFLDDTIGNIEAAREFGLHGIHFKNYEQAKQELEKLLG